MLVPLQNWKIGLHDHTHQTNGDLIFIDLSQDWKLSVQQKVSKTADSQVDHSKLISVTEKTSIEQSHPAALIENYWINTFLIKTVEYCACRKELKQLQSRTSS